MLLLLLVTAVHAFTPLVPGDDPARWTTDNPWTDGVYLPVAGNTLNTSSITPEQLQDAGVSALRQWQSASLDAFAFDWWQGSDTAVFVPSQERDGLSTVFFASSSNVVLDLGPRVAAHTQVWFDDEGQIDEFDLVLNDIDYTFTTDVTATNYTDEGFFGRVVLLQDVLTHELGHALGLHHSGVFDSTMYTTGWADQDRLACDDVRGIQQLYGSAPTTGRLSGEVHTEAGAPLLGVEVQALDLDTLQIAAATLTDADGRYELALRDGEYLLWVAPFAAGADALPDDFSDLDHQLCAGAALPSAPVGGALPDVWTLSGADVDAGMLIVGCDIDALDPDAEEVALDELPAFLHLDSSPEAQVLVLEHPGGALDLTLASYSLFSPVRADLDLWHADGQPVPDVTTWHPTWEDDNGFVVWDAALSVVHLDAGSYQLVIGAALLPPELYPSPDAVSTAPVGLLLQGLPDYAACDVGWDDGPYTSPEGDPLRRELSTDQPAAKEGCGGCSKTGSMPFWWGFMAFVLLVRRRASYASYML